MKVPIVKEYGSWAVFIFSCSGGITAGLLTRPWHTERDFSLDTLLTVLGLAFLVNSKNPLSSFLMSKGQDREHLLWLLFFSLAGFSLLIPFMIEGINSFLIFSPFIISYAILLAYGKEHHLLTELNGFALLTLSAPIVYFVITNEMSLRLYLAVFIFFGAGVFKVRARIKKTLAYRLVMIVYCAASFVFFYCLNISVIMLLPLLENILFVSRMREEKLKKIGDTELIKGIVFTVLLGFFWQ